MERLNTVLEKCAVGEPALFKAELDYRKGMQQRLGFKSFSGIGLPGLHDQNLESIFVSLDARPYRAVDGCVADDFSGNVARDCHDEDTKPVPAEQLIRATPRTVLLGCPGAGKSTLLQLTAVRAARGTAQNTDCLPVFVRLPEFVAAFEIAPAVDFLDWVTSRALEYGCVEFNEVLRSWLTSKNKTVLFLLDGLDEVSEDAQRQRLVEVTIDFVRRFPRHRFCVTSRPVGFDPTPWVAAGFEVCRLVEYGFEQIEQAIAQWSKVLVNGTNEASDTVGTHLRGAILANPRVRQIAANPLILTIMVFLCQARGYSLPRRRVDLYARVIEVFLETWESSKLSDSGFSETSNIDLDARELSWLIADLALEMQRQSLVLAKRWWIEQRIEQSLAQRIGLCHQSVRDVTARILRFISQRTGLLEERAMGLYAFSHRTLQEYFAAVGVVNEADFSGSTLPSLIRPHLFHPQWAVVVRLIASHVTPPRAEALVKTMLDDPDPSGRFLLRGPIMAARCLRDGATVANTQLTQQIFKAFDSLGRSKWIGLTLEAFEVLNELRETRYETPALAAIQRILHEARRSLNDESYGTLVLAAEQAEGQFLGNPATPAVLEERFSVGSVRRLNYVPNFELLTAQPDEWHSKAVELLQCRTADIEAKRAVIWQMGRLAKSQIRSRLRLKTILRHKNAPAKIRAAAARALRWCVSGRGSARALLLRMLDASDVTSAIRASCAFALSDVAGDREVQDVLMSVLRTTTSQDLQACALHALMEAASHQEVSAKLLEYSDETKPEKLQAAAVRGLSKVVKTNPHILERFRTWAFGNDARTRPACQVLAEAMTGTKSLSWDSRLASRIETVLRELGIPGTRFGEPCPHALNALELLVDARESLCPLRTETVLAEGLSPFSKYLDWVFIFGSVARNEQSDTSDIDVMLIGAVTMRDISSRIKQAEQTLGRDINPVIYSRKTFVEKLHAQDAFVTEVVHDAKIPVRIGDKVWSIQELDDELGTMATERMADGREAQSLRND